MTRVLFVRAVDEPQRGDVIAVFVDDKFDSSSRYVTSYMFVGQHSPASWDYIRESTIPTLSSVDCHGSLKKHLESVVGYTDLKVVDWKDVQQLANPAIAPDSGAEECSKCYLCNKYFPWDGTVLDCDKCNNIIIDAGVDGKVLCKECAAKFKNITDEEACMEDL